MKQSLSILAVFAALITFCACDSRDVADTASGELTMLKDPNLGDTGYRDVELYDEQTQKVVHIPAGHYSTKKSGSKIQISDTSGKPVAAIGLKHAYLDRDNQGFYLSSQGTKNTLDIYGGKIYRPLKRVRYGMPSVGCTISCCKTHTECDSEGKNCHSVCDDCSGTEDQVWERVDFRWDYEIFFGKPGDYEVASYLAKGQIQSENKLIAEETCH